MDIAKNIRNNLLRERGLSGFSQSYVGQKVGVTKNMVSKWERGHSLPSIVYLYQLAELYGVTVDDLLQEEGHERNKRTDEIRPSDD